MKHVIIAGCGYIGERLARRVMSHGDRVTCLVRSAEHAASLVAQQFMVQAVSLDSEPVQIHVPVSDAVLFYFVPPPGGGIIDTRARNFISALRRGTAPAKIIYASATSVYSETGGGVVTEESSTDPASAMGKRRLDAERSFLEYGAEYGVPVAILRISGIYGPGRLPVMQITSGQPLLLEEESGMSNRIHADDLVTVCLAAAEKAEAGDIFNVSDGHPSSLTSYFNLCADHLGYPRQPQVSLADARLAMSPLMFSYATESRVVDSSKMRRTLGIVLRYPDMTSGVPAACQEFHSPPKV
jgi:nucleoside-diphosphate-sugar epimerase